MEDTLRSCREFTAVLASAAPTPGGGGAAALTAAIGTALGGMVASLTTGKRDYASVENEIQQLLSTTTALQEDLLDQVAADAEGFLPLAAVYALPKDDPGRAARLLRASEDACAVPLRIMELCVAALDAAGRLADIGSRLAVSDARVRRRHSGRRAAGGVPERTGEHKGHGRGGRTADGAVSCPCWHRAKRRPTPYSRG